MTTNLYTFNVIGLMDFVKRKRVFKWLKENLYDLILLQELHCNDKTQTV